MRQASTEGRLSLQLREQFQLWVAQYALKSTSGTEFPFKPNPSLKDGGTVMWCKVINKALRAILNLCYFWSIPKQPI